MAADGLDGRFVARTLFVAAVVAAMLLLWQLTSVLLLIFGAVIVAVILRSVADPLEQRLHLKGGLALAGAGVLIVAVLAAAVWLASALMADQVRSLKDMLPNSVQELRGRLASLPFGERIAEELQSPGWLASSLNGVAGRIGGAALTAVGATANILLVIVIGAFLAAKPAQARDGFLRLLPHGPRAPAREAMDATGRALKLWLVGTLADMLVVGVLTALGAWIIGLPSPGALGLLAGLAAFVPIVGTIAGSIPGVLLSVQFGPQMIAWTILMYVVVQQLEGNLIYPFIQRRAVNLPPFLTLTAVVAFGILFGSPGIILATPLLVMIHTLTKVLYLKNALGEDVQVEGGNEEGGNEEGEPADS